MKGKAQRNPIIFKGVNGETYVNVAVAESEPVVKENEDVWGIAFVKELKTRGYWDKMLEKAKEIDYNFAEFTFEIAKEVESPKEFITKLQKSGYYDQFKKLVNDLGLEKFFSSYLEHDFSYTYQDRIDETLNGIEIPDTYNTILPYPLPSDNTKKETKSSDKKLLFLGVGLGLAVLFLINQ